jgi:outer membrane murein-binding lipoprotein Lpp
MHRRILAAAAAALLLAGCAKKAVQTTPLTEHQRDSILATEPIPGANAINGAFRAADKEAAHAAAMDSMAH